MVDDNQIALRFKPWIEPADPIHAINAIASYDHAEAQARLLGAQTDETRALAPGKLKAQDAAISSVRTKTAGEAESNDYTKKMHNALYRYSVTKDPAELDAFPDQVKTLAQARALDPYGFGSTNVPRGPTPSEAPPPNQPWTPPAMPGWPGAVPPPPPAGPALATPAPTATPAPAPAPLPMAPAPGGSGLPIPPMPPGVAQASPLPAPSGPAALAPEVPTPPAIPPSPTAPPSITQGTEVPAALPGSINTPPTNTKDMNKFGDRVYPEVLANLPRDLANNVIALDEGRKKLSDFRPAEKSALNRAWSLYNPHADSVVNPSLKFTPQTVANLGERFLATGDPKVLTSGFGRAGAGGAGDFNRRAVMEWITKTMGDRGYTPNYIALKQAEVAGLMASEKNLGNRAATMGMAATVAGTLAPQVLYTSKSVNRTEYPDLNKLILMKDEKLGDENVVRFKIAINSFANAYARVAGGGVGATTDAARDFALHTMNEAWSKGQIRAGIDQILNREIKAELAAPGLTAKHLREVWGGKEIPDISGPDAKERYEMLTVGTPFTWTDSDGVTHEGKRKPLSITVNPKGQ